MQARRGLPLWPLILMVLDVAMLLAMSGSPVYPMVKNVTFAALIVVGLVVSLRAGLQRGVPRPERKPWLFFAGFWALEVVSLASMTVAFSGGPDQPPKPAALAVGVLTLALLAAPMLACLLSFPTPPMTRAQRIRFALDLTTVCGGGFIALWYLVLSPALHSAVTAPRMVTMVTPVLNLVLIFAVCAVMMRGGLARLWHPLTFLLIGNVAAGIALITLGFMAVRLDAFDFPAIDVVVQSSNVLLIMAAVMQRRGIGRGDLRTKAIGQRRPAVMPYLALALGYGVLLSASITSAPNPWVGLIVGALVMTGAIAGRQIIALRENHNFVVRDSLTGLASRVAVYDHLNRAVERSGRTGRPTAVLLIDLNGFKPVNDRLGHAAGDELLVAFGDVLRDNVRAGDTAGRLGGDEFAVILPDVTDAATALKIAESIVAACERPFTAAGEPVKVGASIGVSITEPDKVVEGQELLRRADVAMYQIKRQRSDHDHVMLYELGMDLDPAAVPEPAALPGLNPAELAEYDRLRSQLAELEQKGKTRPAQAPVSPTTR